ncbi:MAG: hypothetical protein NC409_03930 [Clostridium sp.]|nr:hypothetical protein [Clostridium sp.]
MLEHIKNVSDQQRQDKQKAAAPGQETRHTGIPQYILDKEHEPVRRKLDDRDIQAIEDSEIDPRLRTEFHIIYLQNKEHINYADSKKGGDAYIEDGHLSARIVDDRSGVGKLWSRFFGDRRGDIVRQSTILHELTHLAVMNYNIRQSRMKIPNAVEEEELQRIASAQMEEDEIGSNIGQLCKSLNKDQEILKELHYVFPDRSENLYYYVGARLGYITISRVPQVEYPAVVNELNYLFSRLEEPYRSCRTAQLLGRLAEKSYMRRKLKMD